MSESSNDLQRYKLVKERYYSPHISVTFLIVKISEAVTFDSMSEQKMMFVWASQTQSVKDQSGTCRNENRVKNSCTNTREIAVKHPASSWQLKPQAYNKASDLLQEMELLQVHTHLESSSFSCLSSIICIAKKYEWNHQSTNTSWKSENGHV